MAKASPSADTPRTDTPRADRDLAARAICAMYGCGSLDAHRRLDAYAPEIISQMAEQERISRRDRIPAILARAPRPQAKPRSKPNTRPLAPQ